MIVVSFYCCVCFCCFVSVLSGEAVSFVAERLGYVTVAGDGLFVLFEKVG